MSIEPMTPGPWMADRSKGNYTIHLVMGEYGQLVRHDRTGRWFLERPGRWPRPYTVDEAAELVTSGAGTWLRRSGGRRFDRLVAKAAKTQNGAVR